ncbi:MAG: hypothetical protein HRT70_05400, partial [Flavobacteriaceae bacterium]|nr:hypothetical protein [Flavobacteriaceae bacterium]
MHYDNLEQQILGYIGIDPTIIPTFDKYLREEMFSNKIYGAIYRVCGKMYANSETPNELSLSQYFRRYPEQNISPFDVTAALSYPTGGAANIENYAKAIVERWMKRNIHKITSEISVLSDRDDSDAFELLESLVTQAEKVGEGSQIERGAEDLGDLLGQAADHMDDASEGMESGVPSGLTELDELTSG